MNELQKEYNEWLTANNVPTPWINDNSQDISAEALMALSGDDASEWSPNDEQYAWLADFCKRWDKEENWTPCGLNGDWNCQAYHYGENEPNTIEGDYYVLELEGDAGGEGFHVVRYFPNKDDDCTEGLTPNKDREGNNGFPSLASAKAFVEGVFETSERLVKELSAEDRAYVTDEERGEFFGFGAYHDLCDANMVLWDLCSKMSEEQGFGSWDEDNDEEDTSHTLDYFSAISERFNELLRR